MSAEITRKVVEEASSPETTVPERTHPKNCHACANSYMEPSGTPDLICGHPDAGAFGITLRSKSEIGRSNDGKTYLVTVVTPAQHCGDFAKFEQHPQRQQNGSLNPL